MQGIFPEIDMERAFRGRGPRAGGLGEGANSAVPIGPGGEVLGPDNRLPVARELAETSLIFPVHPTLGVSDMAGFARVVEQVMGRATA